MRLTSMLAVSRKLPPSNTRTIPKPAFRRPMQGRYLDRKREPKPWETSMGELDEEMVNELGQTVPMREKVPIIVVPDLKDFKLKPYVSHKVAKHHEPPLQSKNLFDLFYAPQIHADFAGTKVETVPESKDMPDIATRLKNVFTRTSKSKISDDMEKKS